MSTISDAIWDAYNMKCETSFIFRNGTLVCKVTEPLELEYIYKKPEFVAEHEGRSAFLFALIAMYYGESLSLSSRPGSVDYEELFWYLTFLLCHDVGEINGGDTLDDGSNDHSEAQVGEDRVMKKLFSYFPGGVRRRMTQIRKGFEGYVGERGTQLAKAVDKAEAIAFMLYLKGKGVSGDIKLKNPPSKRDIRFAEILGTSQAIDVWCLHYRIATKHMPRTIREPVDNFLAAGFRDAYCDSPKLPLCMRIDVSNIELD